MKDKVWHKVTISMDEQDVSVYPTPEFDGIIVDIKELDKTPSSRLYLNENEMKILILKMCEMMEYVKQ